MIRILLSAFAVLAFVATAIAHDRPDSKSPRNPFVTRVGSDLYLGREPFRFAGANNYYPIYKSPFMVNSLLDRAVASEFRVMRFWSTNAIGNQDGSNSVDGIKEGVYTQYWDGAAPAFNDGPNGLERLDFIIAEAGKRGVKLTLPFVNNWSAFGGIDQYVRWRGGQYHDEFYSDATIRGWYKAWISHLLNRVNTITGVKYKDDPTIMMWELANEPRCIGSGGYPRSPSCTTQTLVKWADEMSTYVKSIDRNHLVSVGDEGFLCLPGATDWTENCSEGVDSYAFAALRNVDAMSMHLYPDPDHWNKTPEWGTEWILKHVAKAKRLRKAVYLGEFGLKTKNNRNPVYFEWTRALFFSGANGAMYWILSDLQDNGTLYPDFDGFTVYCPSPVCTTMSNFSARMITNQALGFPPVADNDSAVVDFGTPLVTFTPASNDISYLGRKPIPGSIDLDPVTAGQQTSASSAAGSFALLANGSVTFTPVAGFSGVAQTSYMLRDTSGRKSNVATISAEVKPDPNAAVVVYSFETDTQGWSTADFEPTTSGTVARVTTYATHGAASLQLNATANVWFGGGAQPSGAISFTGKSLFSVDLQSVAQTSVAIAIKDANFNWCQGNFVFMPTGSTLNYEFSFATTCPTFDFSSVREILLFVNGGGIVNMDNLRVQ